MRQSSLLDSFIKKSIKPSNANNKEEPNKQSQSQQSQISSKKNDKLLNQHDNFTQPQQKPQINKDKNFYHTQYVPQKMQIQQEKIVSSQKQFNGSERSQSPKLNRLKKNISKNLGKPKQVTKKSIQKSAKKKNQSDDLDEIQINSESQDFSPQVSDDSVSQEADLNDDDEQLQFGKSVKKKASKRKPVPKSKPKAPIKQRQQVGQEAKVQNLKIKMSSGSAQKFDRTKFTDKTQDWAIPGNPACFDKYGTNCRQPFYDQTTLRVPKQFLQKCSAPMKQYWNIKSDNFDKVIFFKLGKFYELFYEDALIGNQLLDLKWMATKMHVGFPERSLDRYTQELVKHGLKVVVVQQMETPEEMNNRIAEAKKKGQKAEKTLNRQITQIITKGTIQTEEQSIYLPNYLISVYRHQNLIAYSLLEIVTNSILIGIVDGFQEFKTILYQTRPSELLYDPDNLPRDYVQIMKENIQGMILSKLISKQNLWHPLNAMNQLQQLQIKKIIKKPQILEQIQNMYPNKRNLMISTLSGLFEYLHRIFKFEYVLSTAKFRFYQKEKAKTHMVLDSQALQHLEIFETSTGEKGSLFDKVDRTKTKFGKRLFRKWMTSPLLSEYQINQRLDAVSDLRQMGNQVDRIQKVFEKLNDLQKMCNKLYKYSVSNTSAATAVYFQDLNSARLKEFDTFMKSLQDSLVILKILDENRSTFKSQRFLKLITFQSNALQSENKQKLVYFQDDQFEPEEENKKIQSGLLPDIVHHLQSFKQYIVWKDGKPVPKENVISAYDELVEKQKQVKRKLNEELEEIRQAFKCPDINYAHIKQRYEVQIPERKSIKIPKEFSFSSRKAGFSRYLVPQVQQLVVELEKVEKEIKTQMTIFVTFFFEQFKQKQNIWERYINILAEIDCFCGMAQYSRQRRTSRPNFVEQGYEVKEGIHPSLYSMDFIPNDISFEHPIIILTGPNMGGKSTILRTSCLLAIMAQMGCYVPCKSYRAAIIDRVFTRIGASDKLQAGKSTFFIEMQQTKSIVNHATNRSLAIIDELGRGTATFDGMALAHSVLNYLINKIQCKCFFATHYHSLTEEFASMSGTCLKMMDYEIIKGQEDRIEFLYKLVDGKAEKSFGLNVAQLVGLPKQLISFARVKSDEMHAQIEKKKKKIKIFEVLQEIVEKRSMEIQSQR